MKSIYKPNGIVVLTTHERSGYFTSVLGENIDIRFDSQHGFILQNVLHNVLVAGGSLAIIDEAFFIDTDELAGGLELFFKHEKRSQKLKFIVVSTHRIAGDFFLAFLVLYCHIYNIIYDKTGVEVSINLLKLIERENTFCDVAHLAEPGCWQNAKDARTQLATKIPANNIKQLAEPGCEFAFDTVHEDINVSIGNGRFINISFEVSGIVS